MKTYLRRMAVSLGVLTILILCALPSLAAEKYPSRPITFIIPFQGGGTATTTIRFLAPMLEKELGVPFVVVEKPGSGGAVGWRALQTEPPDGYTLGSATKSLFGVTYSTKGKVDYKNFDPVVMLTKDHYSVTVNIESPWKTLGDYVKYAKANPGRIRAGSSGSGGLWHICIIAFNKVAGVEITHIPFKSGGESFVAVLGNHIESTFASVGDFPGVEETGKLRILAIGGEKRNPFYPDVPTAKEGGVNLVMGNWRGVMAPKGVPKERLEILERAFAKIVKTPQYNEFMKNNKMTNDFMGFSEFKKVYFEDAEEIINYTKSIQQ